MQVATTDTTDTQTLLQAWFVSSCSASLAVNLPTSINLPKTDLDLLAKTLAGTLVTSSPVAKECLDDDHA